MNYIYEYYIRNIHRDLAKYLWQRWEKMKLNVNITRKFQKVDRHLFGIKKNITLKDIPYFFMFFNICKKESSIY